MNYRGMSRGRLQRVAAELAAEKFPLESLVLFGSNALSFGKVRKITKEGSVYVSTGVLEVVSQQLVGDFWEQCLDPLSYFSCPFRGGESTLKFSPFLNAFFDRIYWQRSPIGSLTKPNIDERGLINIKMFNHYS